MSEPNLELDEGEKFVDEAQDTIPPRETWPELTTNQLIDVKLQIENKIWEFSKNPLIVKTLTSGLNEINRLISLRTF